MDDFALAEQLVREAGSLAARMRRNGVTAERKTSVSDIVTQADKAAEALIADRLREHRPDDGIVGEEGAAVPSRRTCRRTWYVDPVDGTFNYASGLPVWCSAVALADEDGPVLGAVYHPAADELWLGGRDRPTTCNGQPVAPLPDRGLRDSALAIYFHPATLPDRRMREPILRTVQLAATIRAFGSGSIELSWVAGGRLGGYVQSNCQPWDWLPGAALVTAARDAVDIVELDGRRWHLAGPHRLVADAAHALQAQQPQGPRPAR